MCKSELHDLLCSLPKCEHHIHIEGTLDPELLFQLAAKNNISLPSDDPAFASPAALRERYTNFTNLDDFLHYYFIGFTVLVTPSDFEDLTYAYLKWAHSQNVHHLEIFFDPQEHTGRGLTCESVVAGMTAAKARAAVDFPELSIMYIPCLVRHLPVASATTMLTEMVDLGYFANGSVHGFGMSSTEAGMHPSQFTSVYDVAKSAGIQNLTAHAGEEGPAEYVSAALSHLGVRRIDHGRRAAEDPLLLAQLAEAEIMLTLCPVSNVVLKGVTSVGEIPIRQLLEAGVPFSLNSDDPAYFGGGVLDNYCAVQEAFDMTLAEWEVVAKGAIKGSWCSDERKQELTGRVDDALQKWNMAQR